MEEGYKPDDDAFSSDSSFDDDIDNISLLPDIKSKPNRLRRRKIRLFRDRSFELNGRMCSKTLVYTSITAVLLVSVVLISIFVKPSSSEEFEESAPEKRSSLQDEPKIPPEDNKKDKAKYLDKDKRVFPWQKIRLPINLVPERYRVELHPNLKTFKFTGSVEMHVKCEEKTNFVFFHAKKLALTKIQVINKVKDKNVILHLGKITESPKLEMVSVEVPSGLHPQQEYIIYVEFNSNLADKLFGFYKSSYKNKKGETRYLATSHFEPTDARAAFPCFDEPALKAKFEMFIVRPKKYTALSNMPLKRSEAINASDLVKDCFMPTVKMSTYLTAIVVCDFKHLSDTTTSGTQVRVLAPPDIIDDAKFALKEATNILAFYENFFKIQFPLPKLDLIAIPDFPTGAMENWGLVTYRLTSMLYNPETSSDANKQWVSTVVAHELAHQWFGNLVTMKWWNDLWLNEGFASFVENIGASHDNPEWHMMDQFLLDKTQLSFNLDQMSNSHPISVPVHNPNQINSLFDNISYDKGASIIRMLRSFIGIKAFQRGLQNYLKAHQFANAETKDLWGELSRAWKYFNKDEAKDVANIMDTWTLQMGFPVVTIRIQNNKAVATQKHFLIHPRAKPASSPFNYKWEIPLTYRTQANEESTQIWMDKEAPEVEIDWPSHSGWIKANYGQEGYYRVNYDQDNWDKLTEHMNKNHKDFSAADRAGLLDDAFNLARAGKLKLTTPLGLTLYLTHEEEYVPWSAALSNLGYLHAMLCTVKDDYNIFKKYMLQQLTPIVNALGWKDEGSHLQKYLRGAALRSASDYGHTKATEEAVKMFNEWKNSGTPIPPNLRNIVYAIGVREGGSDAFDFMFKQYNVATVAAEKRKLMFSLANAKDHKLLEKLLKMSLDSSIIRSQDTVGIITSVAGNCDGRMMALKFMKNNWNVLYKRYATGSFDFSRLVLRVTSHFNTQAMQDEIKSFLKGHDMASAERASEQSLESIQANIDWFNKNRKDIREWMKAHTTKKLASEDMVLEETLQELEHMTPEEHVQDRDYRAENKKDSQYERNYYYQPAREESRYDNYDYFRDTRETGDDYEYN